MSSRRRRRVLVEGPEPGVVKVYQDGLDVVSVERRADGSVVERRTPAEYVNYLSAEAVSREVRRTLSMSRRVRSLSREGDWIRVEWTDRPAAEHGGSFLREEFEIESYEVGVSPARRHMVDNDIRPVLPRRVYLDIETDSRVPFSRKEDMRVLCWCLVAEDNGVLTKGILNEDTDEDEKRLLADLLAALEPFDQIASWNGDGFDFPVLDDRLKARKAGRLRRWLKLDHLEVFKRQNAMAAESGDEKTSFKLQDIGMAVCGEGKVEGFDSSKTWEAWEAGGETRQQLVDYCAQDTVLMRKIEAKTGYIRLLETLCEATGVCCDSRGNRPGGQVESFLLRIGREKGHRFKTRPPSDDDQYKGAFVMAPTERGILKNVHVCDFAALYPSVILSWNMSPETRLPSPELPGPPPIYLKNGPAWKEWKAEIARLSARPEGAAEAAGTKACFSQGEQGLLCIALEELLRLRKHWSELQASLPPDSEAWHDAKRKSLAYKIAANSFYGVIGSPSSIFFDRVLAESVTQTGVWLIKETMGSSKVQYAMTPIAGDTDSAFIAGCSRARFEEFVDWCNAELYPGLLESKGVRKERARIKLAYEKEFERLICGVTDDGAIASKKYCGRLAHFKGTEPDGYEPEIKGFEYKRGDSLKMARELQKTAIDMLLDTRIEEPGPFIDLVKRWQETALTEDLAPEDIRLSKGLSKSLKDYVRKPKKAGLKRGLAEVVACTTKTAVFRILATEEEIKMNLKDVHEDSEVPDEDRGELVIIEYSEGPDHVRVARMLEKRGEDVGEGTRIEYFVADGSSSPKKVLPISDWDGNYDKHDLWESRLYPPTRRLLAGAFPSVDWTEYSKTRPAKVRAATPRKPKKIQGQPGLFDALEK